MFSLESLTSDRKRPMVAKCPECGKPHRFTNVKHPVINDPGYWEIRCSGCAEIFCIPGLHDVFDSFAGPEVDIVTRSEDSVAESAHPVSTEVAVYRLDMNRLELAYDLASCALYHCACEQALDELAYAQLRAEFDEVQREYSYRVHYALKGRFCAHYVTANVIFTCPCSQSHTATFYTRFMHDNSKRPTVENYILADVAGVELNDILDGVRSKNDAMDILGKLILRWNLLADQILIASPFVGHQFMSASKQLEIWEWLLGLLDPQIAIFLTRSTAWTNYRKSLTDAGLPLEVLENFGLENKVVSAGHTKHDFHAKFYVGISEDWSEVYSGSANLVRGPSMENTSFRRMSRQSFNRRYLLQMALKQPLPAPSFKAAERSLNIYRSKPGHVSS
ncbi:hypothetical protein [Vogesella indigofera]|uniref:hypothetical protein n=1 Tax=Vogesella indigofera TaxID=45465 RepID=UPI00234ED2B5|nr:hypothetical protein [Vogesella indigofera]MDC7698013.1 hypothetical protein [Vogesella indigofera]